MAHLNLSEGSPANYAANLGMFELLFPAFPDAEILLWDLGTTALRRNLNLYAESL